jgi:hypothetical protein
MKVVASDNGSRPKHIPPYSRRRDFCRKVRSTEAEVETLKAQGRWGEVSRLKRVLRNAWWGYKRYGVLKWPN